MLSDWLKEVTRLYANQSEYIILKRLSCKAMLNGEIIWQASEHHNLGIDSRVTDSVTRLGDLLHFGPLFKAGGNNYFAQIAHMFRQIM